MSKYLAFFFVGALAVMATCTQTDRAERVLEDQGYSAIEMTGFSRGCSDSDSTCDGFTAMGLSGRRVQGVVGCGREFGGCGKGCTVRLD